jgi:hypothetical protein
MFGGLQMNNVFGIGTFFESCRNQRRIMVELKNRELQDSTTSQVPITLP